MSNNEFDIDGKSLLQANATILAGALIFLSLLRETFELYVTISFLVGIYSIIFSIILCLFPSKKLNIRIQRIRLRNVLCVLGLAFLFLAITLFVT